MGIELTLDVRLVGVLGRLQALLGLKPDKTELVLDVVDHDSLTVTTTLSGFLSRGVGTLELKVLILVLHELLAVALQQETILGLGDLEGVGEELVSGNEVLLKARISDCWMTMWPLVFPLSSGEERGAGSQQNIPYR